jgi:hypothetical protein
VKVAAQFTDRVQHCLWRGFGGIFLDAQTIAMGVVRRPEEAMSRSTAGCVVEAGAGV